jgi:hypothetical protein
MFPAYKGDNLARDIIFSHPFLGAVFALKDFGMIQFRKIWIAFKRIISIIFIARSNNITQSKFPRTAIPRKID